MALWMWDVLLHQNDLPRVIDCGACKDSRITAMWIDTVANVGMFPTYAAFPWDVVTVDQSPWQQGDIRDMHERDLLVGNVPPGYHPIAREQWMTDYPGDAYVDRPQGLSFLAATIVAARRAAGIADGSTNDDGSAAR